MRRGRRPPVELTPDWLSVHLCRLPVVVMQQAFQSLSTCDFVIERGDDCLWRFVPQRLKRPLLVIVTHIFADDVVQVLLAHGIIHQRPQSIAQAASSRTAK